MKIKLFRSATVGIYFANYKLLMDPWLSDGEYYGSWSHYPHYNLDQNLDEINSFNGIYISHIHPDHCSDLTLKKISKKIPIYIHSFHTKFLKLKLERLGFQVIEIQNNKRTEISKNVYLNILAADNCDPYLCYKFIGCADLDAKNGSQQIDTISLIDDGKKVIMNVNDCPFDLAKSTFDTIKNQYDKIDLLCTGYGGAGPYPQCFENLSLEQKRIEGEKKKIFFLNQAIKFINEIKPTYYFPFAGTYTLTGKISHLQSLRGVPLVEEAFDFLENYYSKDKNIKPLRLNCDQKLDLDDNIYVNKFKRINIDDYKQYIVKYLKDKKLTYEDDSLPSFDEIYDLSNLAQKRFVDKKLINSVKQNSDLIFKVDSKSLVLGVDNKLKVINTNEINNYSKKYLTCELDLRLLKKLLLGPKFAHWNNAEIGSHIKFFRHPNNYERDIHWALSSFHA